ncbi:hypothetical protein EIP91_011290 [Steccherinum ochraceum]|uniref:Fungal-type protein kinase domain-containing protein n=1 Tax=Steccherinum ochraceum TaxID=92696 RepID=A0A4R0RBJ1_9APHY|nr:hypothetical protein EIP91_011290 [Steccherinum ochraceum]
MDFWGLQKMLFHVLALSSGASVAYARMFTVYNACPFTIWPAMFTDLNAGQAVPNFPTGWEAAAFTAVSFPVPDNWKAGRIWGRRDCDFTITNGPTCLDGWCNGGLLCDPSTGTGVPPATVAEWTLQGDGNRDFYDVSLVDGYNLPMKITSSVNCPVASCAVDLGPSCPAPLQGPFDSTGFPVGCKSACAANVDGNPTNSPNCCSGSFDTAATCPPSGVQFYDFFKGNCPNAYAYAFDESSNTALWTCDSGLNADYTLTFCPAPNGTDPQPLADTISTAPPTIVATSTLHLTASNTDVPAGAVSAAQPFISASKEWGMNRQAQNDLKAHFRRGSIYRNYPVHQFIRHVWKLDHEQLSATGVDKIDMPVALCKAYVGSKWMKKPNETKQGLDLRPEGDAAQAFANLWNDIESQMTAPATRERAYFFNMEDKTLAHTLGMYKPDLFSSPFRAPTQHWSYTLSVGGLQKKYRKIWENVEHEVVASVTSEQLHAAYSGRAVPSVMEHTAQRQKRKAGAMEEDQGLSRSDNNTVLSTSPKPTVSSRPVKRLKTAHIAAAATPLPADDTGAGPNASELVKSDLTAADLQIIKYIDELMAHDFRTYATGFVLEDNKMTLWYADRMGLVQSASFDIFREPWFLILVIAAHRYGSSHDFGVNPLISLPHERRLFRDYNNALVTLPSAIDATLPPPTASPADVQAFDEGRGDPLTGLQFQVASIDRPSIIAYGTVGRGTGVLPVVAVNKAAELYGNGHLVVKLSCPLEDQKPSEDQFIRVIRRKMRGHHEATPFLKHIVELKCSFNCGMEDAVLGLPRAKMLYSVELDARRSLRALVMPEYLPLEKLSTPEEFSKILGDVMTGHHWVYKTSNILHQDISYGNIMFFYECLGGVKVVVGVLTDWDLAAHVPDDEVLARNLKRPFSQEELEDIQDVTSSSSSDEVDPEVAKAFFLLEDENRRFYEPRTRAGTPAFMSLDLLPGPDKNDSVVPPHQYRHDIESFFWVLAWFCACFDPDSHTVRTIPSWDRIETASNEKRHFVGFSPSLFARTHSSFRRFLYPIHLLSGRFFDIKIAVGMTKLHTEGYFYRSDHSQHSSRGRMFLRRHLKKAIETRKQLQDLMLTPKEFTDILQLTEEDEYP